MDIKVQILESLALVALSGNFDFKTYRDFSQAYAPLLDNDAVHEIEVDLSNLDCVDGAALGMLLMMRERAVSKQIVLANATGAVSQALKIANFNRIFNIRPWPDAAVEHSSGQQ